LHLGLGQAGSRGPGGAQEGAGVSREGGDALRTWSSVHVMGPERRSVSRPVMGDSAVCFGVGGRSVEWWGELLGGVGSGACVVCEWACV
jgi:hypothetical protein